MTAAAAFALLRAVQVSLAHHHMLAVVNSELPAEARAVSILDMGCGDGRMMAFLHRMLREYRPGLELSLMGFDVVDATIQVAGFFTATRALLDHEAPGVDWGPRLELIHSRDRWPYPDSSFDWVISNQVIEHVHDHEFLFGEVARVLKPAGRSAHLFPVRENVLEGHIHIPGSHWIRDRGRLKRYIRMMTALGIGSYRQRRREDPSLDPERYTETGTEYLMTSTNYLDKRQALDFAGRAGLGGSFRYTEHFYWNKLRSLLGLPHAHRLRPSSPPILHDLLLAGLSRVSCVTMLLEKMPGPGVGHQRRTARSTES